MRRLRRVRTPYWSAIVPDPTKRERNSNPENMILLPLPSCSPELNFKKNVWSYLRQNIFRARIYDDYDDIVQA